MFLKRMWFILCSLLSMELFLNAATENERRFDVQIAQGVGYIENRGEIHQHFYNVFPNITLKKALVCSAIILISLTVYYSDYATYFSFVSNALTPTPEGQKPIDMEVNNIPEVYPDVPKQIQSLINLSKQGHKKHQFELGLEYYTGKNIAQNYQQACKWFLEAAEQGDTNAQNNLAACYSSGNGVAQNYAEAFKWYETAAEAGHPVGQYNLGRAYSKGRGVKQNIGKAIEWWIESAIQGNKESHVALMDLVELKKINEVSPVNSKSFLKLVEWYEKLVKSGDLDAQVNLANCYSYGLGVSRNLTKAFELYSPR